MKLAQCRPTTCGTSGATTRWSQRSAGSPPGPQQVAEIEQQLLGMYADPALDRKPELLGERGGAFYSEAAVALLASLVGDTGDTQVVNVRNAGTMPFLPDDAVIEVPAVIGAGGAAARPGGPADPLMRGLVGHVSGVRGTGGGRGGARRARTGCSPRCWPTRWSASSNWPGADRPADRREPGLPAVGRGPVTDAGGRRLPAVLAVDGGNSKTDVALVAADGTLLGTATRPGHPTPTSSGCDQAIAVLADLVMAAARRPGRRLAACGRRSRRRPPVAAHVSACLANADLPEDEERLAAAGAAAGLGGDLLGRQRHVRGAAGRPAAGTRRVRRGGRPRTPVRPWGVGVTCGAGINCVGVAPDGREHRFLSLGPISGDWGGGDGLGRAALWRAVRAEDGRGPGHCSAMRCRALRGAHVSDVTLGIHHGKISEYELLGLAPVLLRVAATGTRSPATWSAARRTRSSRWRSRDPPPGAGRRWPSRSCSAAAC